MTVARTPSPALAPFRAFIAWAVRSVLMVALVLTLARRDAAALSPTLMVRPPSVSVQSRIARNDDLSAGVRVHRGGRTLDVWLVTPHSKHWDALAVGAPPLDQQLESLAWEPFGGGGKAARFERLVTPALPRLLMRRGPAFKMARAR